MQDEEWRQFFVTAVRLLGPGDYRLADTPSWCAWTTFSRLAVDAGYWTHGLPREQDILATHIGDGGSWGQPFAFSDLAHVIIPSQFYWETRSGAEWQCGSRLQDIAALSLELQQIGIGHRRTAQVLEIKLY